MSTTIKGYLNVNCIIAVISLRRFDSKFNLEQVQIIMEFEFPKFIRIPAGLRSIV